MARALKTQIFRNVASFFVGINWHDTFSHDFVGYLKEPVEHYFVVIDLCVVIVCLSVRKFHLRIKKRSSK